MKENRKTTIQTSISHLESEIESRNKEIKKLQEELDALITFNKFDQRLLDIRKEELSKLR